MDREFNDRPISESSVTLRLADIQRRCSQMVEDDDALAGLTLAEPFETQQGNNPYNRG